MNRKTNTLLHRKKYAERINQIIILSQTARRVTLPEVCVEKLSTISLIAQEIAEEIKQKYLIKGETI